MRPSYLSLCWIALAIPVCTSGGGPQSTAATRVQDDGLRRAVDRVLYSLQPEGHSKFRGVNQEQRLSLEFDDHGARLLDKQGDLALHVSGYGHGSHLREPLAAHPDASGNRIEYRRGELTEWYENSSAGLEQGFTLRQRPGEARDREPLVIALNVAGTLKPTQAPDNTVLLESGNKTILRYSGLRAWDARGRDLASRLEVRKNQIRLVVDDREAEYPVVVDPFWTQQAELIAPDGAFGDSLGGGGGNSISVSGDTAVIGAPFKSLAENFQRGAAYVFVRTGTTWALQQELTASDGFSNDFFGFSVSVDGNTAVIGAYQKSIGENSSQGAAYVFVRNGTTWTQQQELLAPDGAANDQFGFSVSVSGNSALIGAINKSTVTNVSQGAAYVFVRSGTTWTQQQELFASNGASQDMFGSSVSLSADTALIGAAAVNSQTGAAYVFVRNGTTWTQQQELTASDGQLLDNFGFSVSVSGNTAVIGMQIANDLPGKLSSAYVFVRNGTSWTQQQELNASDETVNDAFASAVSISGDIVVAGAAAKSVGANSGQGSAYVFVRSGGAWTQQQELTSSDGAAADAFGSAVAINGNTAIVGAGNKTFPPMNFNQGAAYVYIGLQFVSTSPSGLSFSVDGNAYNSPQSFSWVPGSSHTLSTTSPQPSGAGSQLAFMNWSDGGAITHTVAPTIPSTFQANFGTQYLLSISADPSSGGTVSPSSGFYNAGTVITVQATPAAGYQFVSWSGNVANSSSPTTTVTMSGPQSVTANFKVTSLSILNPSVGPGTVGVGLAQVFQATGGFRPYVWSATGLPSWLTLGSSGLLTGTPPPGSAGTYTFTITVSDLANTPPASATITLVVNPAPLAITTSQLPTATENSLYNATLSASGGTTPYSWTGSGLPSWLSLSSSGKLSGTPPLGSAGGVAFSVTVTDSAGLKASATLTIAIASASGKPVITTPSPLPQATAGVFYTQTLSVIGGTAPYKWVPQSLAGGLSISASGVLSGTPTAPGTLDFTAQVNDSSSPVASAFQEFSLTVVAQPVSVANLALAEAHLNIPYQQTFFASGGTQQFFWSVVSGSLPPGLTLNSNGILSGTPTSAGTSNFTIGATDTGSTTSPLPHTVQAVPRAATPAATASYQLVVEPAKTDLAISAGSLEFSGVANGSDPPSQNVAVISTDPNTPLPFSVTTDAPWLFVTQASGTTPANIVVQVRIIGLQVQTYNGHITFSSPGLAPQVVTVSMTVAAPSSAPPAVAISPGSLELSTVAGSTTPIPFAVLVKNTGSGAISFSASASGASWLSVVSGSGSVAANSIGTVNLQADPTGLVPGFYLGTVEVDSGNSSAQIPVTLFVANAGRIFLNFSGATIEARAGNPAAAPATLSFSVLGSDSTPIAFAAQQTSGAGFLTLQTSGGSATNQAPAAVSYTVNTAGLAAGAYYGRILISAPGAVDSPQTFVVVVNVIAANQPPNPVPSPAGLVFISGATAPPKQTVSVFTSSSANVAFQASASTLSGGSWLSVTPTTGNVSSSSPGQLSVTANPAGLTPGVYRGTVNIAETNLAARSVNVTLIVTAAAPKGSISPRAQTSASCSPNQLVITQTGLAGNFSAPASWPQTLAVVLNDNCGNLISTGSIAMDFSNGDPPLRLPLSDPTKAAYTATWTPSHNSAQMTITAKASATGFPSASVTVVGSVTPNVAPVLAPNGIVNNFFPEVGAPLSPGAIVQIFGTALASGAQSATTTPLPAAINGTSVVIGGLQAPLFFVSPNQINAQIPNELIQGNSYDVVVIANNAITAPQPVYLNLRAPGVARFADGHVIAQHSDFSLVTTQSPARPGEYLIIYLGGLGQGNQTVASGTPSPLSPLDSVPDVTITVAGQSAPVVFSGLTPGLVGLYQINFQVPQNVPAGDVMLQVTQDGYTGNTSLLTIGK